MAKKVAPTYSGLDPMTGLPVIEKKAEFDLDNQKKHFFETGDFINTSSVPDVGGQPIQGVTLEEFNALPKFGGWDKAEAEDVRAEQQSVGESLMFGAGRFLTTTGTKALSGISSLGEFIVNSGRAIAEGSLDPYADTPISDSIGKLEEAIKNSMPIYNTHADQEKNFLQRAFTDLDFWTNDMVDGAAFMASAMLTGYGGMKLLGPLTKARYAAQLEKATALGMEELAAAEAAGADAVQINKIRQANALRKEALAASKQNMERLTMTGLSRSTESLMEGKQSFDTTYENLKAKGYSDEEAKSEAAKAAMLVAGLNMTLAPLDYDQYGGWFKTFSKSRDKLLKIGAEGVLESAIPSFKASFLKHVGRNAFSEGILEEGLQQAMQTYAEKKYNGDYGTWEKDPGGLMGTLEEYVKGFATKEGWDAMGAGMILGGLFGGFTEATQESGKQARKKSEELKSLISNNDYLKKNFKSYVIEDPETGGYKINEAALLKDIDQMGKDGLLSEAMTSQLSNNYEEAYKTLDNLRFSNWVFSHFESGMGEHLMQKIDELGELSDEELKNQGILNEDMKNSEGKLVTAKEIASRYKEKALEYEKIYNQISSRFEIPNRAVHKNIFDEAILQKETGVSLEKVNEKIYGLQSKLATRNASLGTDVDPNTLPKGIEDLELELQQNRKKDLINTLRDSYKRLDDWTNPKKLEERAKKAAEAEKEQAANAMAKKIGQKLSKPDAKLSKEEEAFYNSNKEKVDKFVDPVVAKKTEEVKKANEAGLSKLIPVKGSIRKPGVPNSLKYSAVEYVNGFPVFTITLPDGTQGKVSGQEGWAPVDLSKLETPRDFEPIGRNHFSSLFHYRRSYENDLLKNVKNQVTKPDGSKFTEEELLAQYPQAFPSLIAGEVLQRVMLSPNWKDSIKLTVTASTSETEDVLTLNSGLYGNRPKMHIVLSITDPGNGQVHEIHNTQNPYFFSYKDTEGNLKIVDFTNITLDQFNSYFALNLQGKPATQYDLDSIKQQWFDLKEFYDKVSTWYAENSTEGPLEIPFEWYNMSPSAALDVITSPDKPLTPLTSVESLKDAPIVFGYTMQVVNNKPLPSSLPDIPDGKSSRSYFVLHTDTNGSTRWIRATPKKLISGEESLAKINKAVNDLYSIDPDLVGTPEGDARAKEIISELAIYVAKTTEEGTPKIYFDYFRSKESLRYYLQLESSYMEKGEKKYGKLVFESNKTAKTFADTKELSKFLYDRRNKLGQVVLNIEKDFRQSVPKNFTSSDAGELFDIITTSEVVKDRTVRFSFGNVLPETMEVALGLQNMQPKKPKAVKTSGNNEIDSLEKEIEQINKDLATKTLTEAERKTLANKKENRLNKLNKLKDAAPITLTAADAEAAKAFMGGNTSDNKLTVEQALNQFVQEVIALGIEIPAALNLDTEANILAYLEVNAKASNSKVAEIANKVLNNLVKENTVDPITLAFGPPTTLTTSSGKTKTIKTVGTADIEELAKNSDAPTSDVPPDLGSTPTTTTPVSDIERRRQEEFIKQGFTLSPKSSSTEGPYRIEIDKSGEAIISNEEDSPEGIGLKEWLDAQGITKLTENLAGWKRELAYIQFEVIDKINAKYDAELAALKNTPSDTTSKKKKTPKFKLDAGEKVGYIAPGEPWTVQHATNWLQSKLPKGIKIEEISELMSNLENGNIRYGYFHNNVLVLKNNAPRTLAFHEAFHAIFRAVLSSDKRAAYINKIKQELNFSTTELQKRINALRATNPKNYAGLSNAEMANRVYEEELADKYAAWQNKRGTQRALWQKLFDLIQRIVDFVTGNSSVNSLFRKIERGGFRNSNVNPGFAESADKIIGNLSPIKSEEIVFNVAGGLINKQAAGIQVTIDDILDDFKRLYDPQRPENIKLIAEKPNLAKFLDEMWIFDDTDERTLIKEQVKKILGQYNFSQLELDINELENDSEGNAGSDTERMHDKSTYEYDPYESVGTLVKKFFGTVTYEGSDDFGNIIVKALDPRGIYSRLLPALSASSIDRSQLIEKLKVMAEGDNIINAIYKRLIAVTGYSEETPNGVGNGKQFFNQFKRAFEVYQYQYTQTTIDTKTGAVKAFYLNRTDVGKYAIQRWENDFRQYILPKLASETYRRKIINEGLNKVLQFWNTNPAAASNLLYNTLLELKINVVPKYLDYSLKVPSVASDTIHFDDVHLLTIEDVQALKDHIEKGKDPFEKGNDPTMGMVTRLKEIAAANAVFDVNVILPNFKAPDGNTIYSYGQGNLAFMTSLEISRSARDIEWIRAKMADPRFANNPLFTTGSTQTERERFAQVALTNINVSVTGMASEENTSKGVTAKNLDVQTAQMQFMSMFGSQRPMRYGSEYTVNQAQYWLTIVAEKNTQLATALPSINAVNKDADTNELTISAQAKEALFNMFVQEERRLSIQSKGNPLGYLNNNRVYFEYLEGIKLRSDFLQNPSAYKNSVIEQILYGVHDAQGIPNQKGLVALIDQYVQNVEDNKLFYGMDKTVLVDKYGKDSKGKRAQFETAEKMFVYDMFLNDFIWANSYLQLIGMDLAIAKNYEDFVKRAALLIASGPASNESGSSHIISFSEESFSYVDKDTFARVEKPTKNSARIPESDAQVLSIPQSIMLDDDFQGKLDRDIELAYQRSINPLVETGEYKEDGTPILEHKPLSAKEKSFTDFLPRKEVITAVTSKGEVVYQKMAVAILTKEFTSYWDKPSQKWLARPGYEELHNKREHMEKLFEKHKTDNNGVAATIHMAPKSASKLFFGKNAFKADAFKSYTEDGETQNSNVGTGSVETGELIIVDNKNRRDQVKQQTKPNDSMIYSLQQHSISGSELMTAEGRELNNQKENAFAELKNDAFNFAANLVRSLNNDGSIKKADLEVFLESLRNQILATTPDSQLYEFLKSDGNGDFLYSPDLVHVSSKFESLFLSVFKDSFRLKIRGRKATLMADQGVGVLVEISTDEAGNEIEGKIISREEFDKSEDKSIYKDKKKYKSRRLNFMQLTTDAEGNSVIKPAEIMMTRKTAEMKGINITDPSRSDYMKVICTRIPTQNYHSIAPSQIVDFLPEEYGDTMIGPKELVLMMGADFDVDASYTYMQDFWKKGKITIKYGEETSPKDKYEAFRYWHLNNNKYVGEQFSKLKDADPRITELLSLLSRQKELFKEGSLLREIIGENIDTLKNLDAQVDDINSIGKIVTSLGDKLLEVKMESGDISTVLAQLEKLQDVYEELTIQAFKSVNLPGNFAEWQASGSPVSRGELYNRLFDVNYKILTRAQLWDAYKQFLDTNSIEDTLKLLDEASKNKEKPIIAGNSLSSKANAFAVNSASKDLRGIVVSGNVAGMFMRYAGIGLKEGISFLNDQGEPFTYFSYPTVNGSMTADEATEAFKNIRNISDTGSQMVGIVIDDPKAPKIYRLNWNKATLSAISEGISLGMPRDFVFKTFSLPIFSELNNNLITKTRAIAPDPGGKSKAAEEIEGKYETFFAKIADYLKQTKLFTQDQINSISEESANFIFNGKAVEDALMFNSKINVSSKSIVNDLASLSYNDIVKEMAYYKTMAKAFELYTTLNDLSSFRLGTLTKFSALNKKIGSTLKEVNDISDALEMLNDEEANPFIGLKQAIEDNTNMSANIENALKVADISRLFFTKQTPFFKDFISATNKLVKSYLTNIEKEQISRLAMAGLVSHVVSKATGEKDYWYLLEAGGENSIVKQYENLKSIPEFRDNPFVKWAYTKKYNRASKEFQYPIDTLSFDTFTKLDPSLSERIQDGHISLLTSDNPAINKFGQDLFWYFVFKDGMMFKSESPGKFLSANMFEDISQYLKKLNNISQGDYQAKIQEFFNESPTEVADRFTENLFRHTGFTRYFNFITTDTFRKAKIRGRKNKVPMFNLDFKENGKTMELEYTPIVTTEEANKYLKQKNIDIKVFSGLDTVKVKFPKFLAISRFVDNRYVKYRYKLESSENGKAVYKEIKAFGDYNQTMSPFPYTPAKNEQFYGKLTEILKSKGIQIPNYQDMDFGDNFEPDFDPSTEFSREDMPEIDGKLTGNSVPSEFKDLGTPPEYTNVPAGFDEAMAGLKSFTKTSGKTVNKPEDTDFDNNDIPTKCN